MVSVPHVLCCQSRRRELSMRFATAQTNLAVTLVAAAVLSFYLQILPLSWIYDNFLPLLTAATTITVLLVVVLYTSSFSQSRMLALGGNTDSSIYNFFIGRELNPRIGTFDLKHFCELYPGLIGWLMIDLGMLQKQYEKHGYVSTSMALVCMFQFVYILDALCFETAILSTMDIVYDGFGFMLAFGDLVWVPFTYSLQARYLVDRPQVSSSMHFTIPNLHYTWHHASNAWHWGKVQRAKLSIHKAQTIRCFAFTTCLHFHIDCCIAHVELSATLPSPAACLGPDH